MNCLRFASAALLLVVLPSISQAADLVAVQLLDGTTRVAEIDVRTDGEFLWLRSTGRVTTLIRPVSWARVESITPILPTPTAADSAGSFAEQVARALSRPAM